MKALNPIFLLVALLMLGQATLAQYPHQAPHWRVHTDPATLTTTVYFFNADQQLIYQESLPGKYVKLTGKNTRKLDRILAEKTSQALVATKVPLVDLNRDHLPIRPGKAFSFLPGSSAADWTCQTVVGQDGHLVVWIDNPLKKRLTLTLKSEKGTCIYSQGMAGPRYQRSFKVSHLSRGRYQLLITDQEKSNYYRHLLISWPPKTALLQTSSTEAAELMKK